MLEVLFVGTGDAFGSGGRRYSAILVRDGQHTLLLDCGPTTLNGLQELGVDPREIDAVAISHFHGDHAAGTPFLLLDYVFEHPRTTSLEIIGPPGIEELTLGMSSAFCYETERSRAYELRFREFSPGTRVELSGFAVTPAVAHHHPETKPHMLRVEGGDRSLFFTGDTGWHEALPTVVADVNLLIAECVFMEEKFEYHLSYSKLDETRDRFDCDRLLLTHLGSEVLSNLDLVHFDTAHDGLLVKI